MNSKKPAISQIRFLRGTEANRTTFVPAEGEPVYTTDQKRLYIGDGSTLGGVPLFPEPTTITGSYTTAGNEDIFADVRTSPITITLPTNPWEGLYVKVFDLYSYSAINTITVSRNGSNINSLASDYLITSPETTVLFTYSGDATVGWITEYYKREATDNSIRSYILAYS